MIQRGHCFAVCIGIVMLTFVGTATAGEILNFAPGPVSPTQPEFIWSLDTSTGSAGLSSGSGSFTGNGVAGAPGLEISVPFEIPGIADSVVAAGATTFSDAELEITSGFQASGDATSQVVTPGYTVLTQPLGVGTVIVQASDGTLLL